MIRATRWLAGLGLIVLAGCFGGGGGGGGGHDNGASIVVCKEVDLATGVVTDRSSLYNAASASDAAMVFRRIPAGGGQGVFWIAVYETTQAQWLALSATAQAVVADTELDASAYAARKPAFALSFTAIAAAVDAYDAAHGVTSATPHHLALPTSAQWTRACAAGSSGAYAWGSSRDLTTAATYAVVRETRAAYGPATVGSRTANAFGLYDLHGNVWELVDDGEPWTTARGGSWRDNLVGAATPVARDVRLDTPHALIGVRLVLMLP